MVDKEMGSELQYYIVETDAIYGGGVQLKRGDVATREELGPYFDGLLEAGAIRLLADEKGAAGCDSVSLR